jgi:hypothetical protein
MERHRAGLLRDTVCGSVYLGHHSGYCEKPIRPGLRMIRPIATEIGLFLTPFVVYAAFLLATRAWHLASERLDALPPRRSRHCVTDIDGWELCRAGAIRAGAARLDLRAGARRGRQVRAENVSVTGVSHLRDAAWLRDGEVARLLALLDSAAARCAIRCCDFRSPRSMLRLRGRERRMVSLARADLSGVSWNCR